MVHQADPGIELSHHLRYSQTLCCTQQQMLHAEKVSSQVAKPLGGVHNYGLCEQGNKSMSLSGFVPTADPTYCRSILLRALSSFLKTIFEARWSEARCAKQSHHERLLCHVQGVANAWQDEHCPLTKHATCWQPHEHHTRPPRAVSYRAPIPQWLRSTSHPTMP